MELIHYIYGQDFSSTDWLATVSIGLILISLTVLIAARLSDDITSEFSELYVNIRNRNKR